MKQRPWKRALSLMLAFALVFAMPCVTGVYAAGEPVDYIERWWDEDEQKVMDSQKSVTNYTEVENSTTAWDGDTTGGWYVVSGKVEATGTSQAAGIGGGSSSYAGHGGSITITGGEVKATGGDQASGIGGGSNGSGGDITITGGTEQGGSGQSGAFSQPAGCVSDTLGEVNVSGAYQFRLTSTNGTAPVVELNSTNFRAVLASQEGNDYFWKIYAVGLPGQTCTVTVNGTAVARLTLISSIFGGVSSDTTAPFTVPQGGSYQFCLTAVERPKLSAGSSSFVVEYVGNKGFDWFFRVVAVGKPGDGCGFYINGAPVPVAVAHIS